MLPLKVYSFGSLKSFPELTIFTSGPVRIVLIGTDKPEGFCCKIIIDKAVIIQIIKNTLVNTPVIVPGKKLKALRHIPHTLKLNIKDLCYRHSILFCKFMNKIDIGLFCIKSSSDFISYLETEVFIIFKQPFKAGKIKICP